MVSRPIRAFRPFDLQHQESADEMYQDVQVFVYYCEARFHAIIAAILSASPQNRKWMQMWLQQELVSCFICRNQT